MGDSLSRKIQEFVGTAEQQGFRIKVKKSGIMVYGKGGGAVMLHNTPSDRRGVQNARARLRSLGVTF